MTTAEFLEHILQTELKALSCHMDEMTFCVGVADDGTKDRPSANRNGLAEYFCILKEEYCAEIKAVSIFEHGTDRALGYCDCLFDEDSGEIE